MSWRAVINPAVIVVAITLCVGRSAIADEKTPAEAAETAFSQLQIRFGIPINIELYVEEEATAKGAFDAAFDEAKRLDRVFSDYDPDSEARKLASLPRNVWHPASADLVYVCRQARRINRASDGAFDVSVGPLTHLWRKTMRFKTPPEPDVLAAALQKVGNSRWNIRDNAIRFSAADMRLDFGGIAKGYALDRMATVLREQGVESYLIDAGGDILCGDPPPGRDHWRVEIEAPKNTLQPNAPQPKPTVLAIANRAVATSGASYQSVTLNGKRYSHIVDPRTGYGVEFVANVTVQAPTGILADALASAVSVLGPDSIDDIKEHFAGVKVTIAELSDEIAAPKDHSKAQ